MVPYNISIIILLITLLLEISFVPIQIDDRLYINNIYRKLHVNLICQLHINTLYTMNIDKDLKFLVIKINNFD